MLTDAKNDLGQIGSLIQSRYPTALVYVIGHTDSVTPSKDSQYSTNAHLSKARANEVASVLVNGGVVSKNIRSIGMGSSQPLATNSTREGRLKNRRVEILLFDEKTVPIELLIREADDLIMNGDLSGAEIVLTKALKEEPNNYSAWRRLGNVFYASGNHERAIEALRRALDLKPDDIELRRWLDNLGNTN